MRFEALRKPRFLYIREGGLGNIQAIVTTVTGLGDLLM